jgi:hypothetical protein
MIFKISDLEKLIIKERPAPASLNYHAVLLLQKYSYGRWSIMRQGRKQAIMKESAAAARRTTALFPCA